jgi:muramidase (phage lysozyme)
MFGDLPDASPNRIAFLDMIAWSEGTSIITSSDCGYNVLVGSTPDNPLLFQSYEDHPRILNKALDSTAAGRYQLIERYFDDYKALLKLPDFSPTSQDAIAMQQIREQGALTDIDSGDIATAIQKVSSIWASFPGNSYGQHQQNMADLLTRYQEFGGDLEGG